MTEPSGGEDRSAERYEVIEVLVAIREESHRAFAVAVLAGREGHTELHRIHVDAPTIAEAVADALHRVLGVEADAQASISVHDALVFPEASTGHDFFKLVGAGFDAGFPKGIGAA